jgi:putative phosphoesterase
MSLAVQRKQRVIGVISDTHGPLSASAKSALLGVDLILHAGDIMDDGVLSSLGEMAPVVAVRGNMDGYGAPRGLDRTAVAEIAGIAIYLLHDLAGLDLDPKGAGIAAVVHGHTHRADISWRDGVLYLNPGSAAEPRGRHPASIARITMVNGTLSPEIVPLGSPPRADVG